MVPFGLVLSSATASNEQSNCIVYAVCVKLSIS
uniref:Uncharacterized protein n=1 Tax=Arundo donax TaxID=35708 RepID=A0A0A9ADF6_ARUDO